MGPSEAKEKECAVPSTMIANQVGRGRGARGFFNHLSKTQLVTFELSSDGFLSSTSCQESEGVD